MDFLKNVKEIVSDTTQTVVKKSGEFLEASKVQMSIFELNGDVKKLYTDIGKLTYEAVENGADHTEEIKMKCEIIAAKLAKIEALKNSGADGEFKCPSCGRPADGSSNYCPSCGAEMTVTAEAEVVDAAPEESETAVPSDEE